MQFWSAVARIGVPGAAAALGWSERDTALIRSFPIRSKAPSPLRFADALQKKDERASTLVPSSVTRLSGFSPSELHKGSRGLCF